LCLRNLMLLGDLPLRVLICGSESPSRRLRPLLHTWLGAYYALSLRGRGVSHIHVHHGYFASWVAVVAARRLGIDFKMMRYGSERAGSCRNADLAFSASSWARGSARHCSF